MWGKYLSRGRRGNFYLPGQEIKINKSMAFNILSCEQDSLSTCKARMLSAIAVFAFVYIVIAVRLFTVCISGEAEKTFAVEDNPYLHAYMPNPIKRADILDRNGIISATSLPTVNLFANPKRF